MQKLQSNVVFMVSDDDRIHKVRSMQRKEDGRIDIELETGEIVSGASVRYAREIEERANRRLPHDYQEFKMSPHALEAERLQRIG